MRRAQRSALGFPAANAGTPARVDAAFTALGYARVPADAEAGETALDAQAEAIASACASRRLALREIVCDVESQAEVGLERPGLRRLLERIADDEARSLVVAGFGGLGLPAAPLGALIDWLARNRARLIAADLDLDTSVRAGRVAARALVAAGGLERQKLRDRTREGLAGTRQKGAVSGRPSIADRPAVTERIVRLRARGLTLQAIADLLNRDGVPTLRGGTEWRPSSVQAAAGYKQPDRERLSNRPPGRGAPPDGRRRPRVDS